MFRTKLALITALLALSLTGCLTDDTKTIDESTEIRDDDGGDDGAADPEQQDPDLGDCQRLPRGELDCPVE